MAVLFDDPFLRVLESLNLIARKIFAGEAPAERVTLRRGGSVEFTDHRPYSAGDELRYVDWNVYARHGHLVVKEFAAEEDAHLLVLLDTSASMAIGAPTKFEAGARLTAALGYIGLANFDTVTVAGFGNGTTEWLRQARGRERIFDLFGSLASARPDGPSDFRAALLHPFPRRRGRELAILVSDFLDLGGYADAIKALRGARMRVGCCHLVSTEETGAPPSGRVRLYDPERGERREVHLTPEAVERYSAGFRAWLAEVERFCAIHEVSYQRFSSGMPVEEMVLTLLRRGQFLTWR
ncbi:MAG: DUF58 domain-containing protein [Planctomycetes bacterium]|nr:DUF58 domain-containing protein [Planctomycetota bacterium]